jgi:hypothetical protein
MALSRFQGAEGSLEARGMDWWVEPKKMMSAVAVLTRQRSTGRKVLNAREKMPWEHHQQ